MTTSQQPRYGRHARLDEPGDDVPPVPLPRAVGEHVSQAGDAGSGRPGFGRWPYGPRRDEEEPEFAGPNPYLPCEEASPEVRLAPGGLPGTLALLAGVAGIGLALFPFVAIAVWPLTIVGLVLGVVGLRRVRAGVARNRVAAVTGIVLSALALALCAWWLSLFAAVGPGAAEGVIDQGPVPSLLR